jgi:hypothetical protein
MYRHHPCNPTVDKPTDDRLQLTLHHKHAMMGVWQDSNSRMHLKGGIQWLATWAPDTPATCCILPGSARQAENRMCCSVSTPWEVNNGTATSSSKALATGKASTAQLATATVAHPVGLQTLQQKHSPSCRRCLSAAAGSAVVQVVWLVAAAGRHPVVEAPAT